MTRLESEGAGTPSPGSTDMRSAVTWHSRVIRLCHPFLTLGPIEHVRQGLHRCGRVSQFRVVSADVIQGEGADGGFIRISMNYLKPDQVRNPDSLLGRKSTKKYVFLLHWRVAC